MACVHTASNILIVPSTRLRVAADGATSWQVRFRINNQYQSRTFYDQREAARFSTAVDKIGAERALEVFENRTQRGEVPTLTQYCYDHIAHLTGVGNHTLRDYRRYTKNNLGKLAHLPVDMITRKDIALWVNEMAMRPGRKPGSLVSGKTLGLWHGFIAGVLNGAVRDELITVNPCNGTRLPRTLSEEMTFLTHDEYLRFIGCFPEWRQPMVATMFSTGLRWGEISALKVGDLQVRADGIGVLVVNKAWKDGGKEIGPTKTRRSNRTVALSPEVLQMLMPLKQGRDPGEWLFTAKNGHDPVKYNTFRREYWLPALALANGQEATRKSKSGKYLSVIAGAKPLDPPLGKWPRIHDARHTAASWLLAAGIPINYVQAHLGHESIQTTVDRYGHIMPGAGQAIAAAMSIAMSPAHPLELTGPAQQAPSGSISS